MLTEQEKRFISWWEANKLKERKSLKKLLVGLPIGLIFGISILLMVFSGWHKRATMSASTQFNPIVFMIAILAIIVFISLFYMHHRWEMNDQRYRELIFKQKKEAGNTV